MLALKRSVSGEATIDIFQCPPLLIMYTIYLRRQERQKVGGGADTEVGANKVFSDLGPARTDRRPPTPALQVIFRLPTYLVNRLSLHTFFPYQVSPNN